MYTRTMYEDFLETHPDFQTYTSERFEVTSVPSDLCGGFASLASDIIEEDPVLAGLCNKIAALTFKEPTNHWGRSFLNEVLTSYCCYLDEIELPDFLDMVYEFLIAEGQGDAPRKINKLFEKKGLGYRYDSENKKWECLGDTENHAEALTEALDEIQQTPFQQTKELIEQAKKSLENAKFERDYKDAVRSTVSAMESFLKSLTGTRSLKEAVNKLKSSFPEHKSILSDALTIWNKIHDDYPDVRHGTDDTEGSSRMSDFEARYWIQRTMAYVQFLGKLEI